MSSSISANAAYSATEARTRPRTPETVPTHGVPERLKTAAAANLGTATHSTSHRARFALATLAMRPANTVKARFSTPSTCVPPGGSKARTSEVASQVPEKQAIRVAASTSRALKASTPTRSWRTKAGRMVKATARCAFSSKTPS